MTSWVLTIAEDYPNHWDIAKANRLWDMTKARPVKRGDAVYFWVTGGHGFIGRVEVSADARAIASDDVLPWTDRGERDYVSRFEFSRADDLIAPPVLWHEVAAATGFPKRPDWAPPTDDSTVESWLRSLFVKPAMADEVAEAFETADDAAASLANLQQDRRERVLAEIAVRRGQGRFRDVLLSAYDRQCTVTGTRTETVLEAAHISPYKGVHTNLAVNGLLLRSDIHTLFDLHLLTISADADRYIFRVDPAITEEEYRALDGCELRSLPADEAQRPSGAAMADHNDECEWFERASSPARADVSY
jgi:putative restriction endonuclease